MFLFGQCNQCNQCNNQCRKQCVCCCRVKPICKPECNKCMCDRRPTCRQSCDRDECRCQRHNECRCQRYDGDADNYGDNY